MPSSFGGSDARGTRYSGGDCANALEPRHRQTAVMSNRRVMVPHWTKTGPGRLRTLTVRPRGRLRLPRKAEMAGIHRRGDGGSIDLPGPEENGHSAPSPCSDAVPLEASCSVWPRWSFSLVRRSVNQLA